MELFIFDGLYPSNPLYTLPFWMVILFEILVICLEAVIIASYYENKKIPLPENLILLIVIGNIATFVLGVLLNALFF